jgi:hypothetical protein
LATVDDTGATTSFAPGKENAMKKASVVLAAALVAGTASPSYAGDRTRAAIGGALGGVTGAMVGQNVGGSNGALVGAALG